MQELQDVIHSLASNKKKERLVSLERIQNLIKQDNIVKYLNCEGDNKTISWDILFIRVHNTILQEVDRAQSRKMTTIDKQLQILQSIILDICYQSIHEEAPLLKCDTIIRSILCVFESDFKMKCLGSTYTEVLLKYVLGNRKFWGEIKREHWIELKDLCKRHFKQPLPNNPSAVFLDALSDITRLSCKNALICPDFLDLFCFVNDVFTSHTGAFCNIEMSLLRLINILCLQLAVEFRYKVCAFMEDIFDYVLNLYDKKKNSKNRLIYHFLIIYLNVHNPNGASQTEDLFYAFDEQKWKQHILTIYSFTQKLVNIFLKNSPETEPEVELLDLIVEINHLVLVNGFDNTMIDGFNCESSGCSESPGCSKKRKRSMDFCQLSGFSNLLSGCPNKYIKLYSNFECSMLDPQNEGAWFWLLYLEVALQKYPQILRIEYERFTEFLSKLFFDFRDSKNIQPICRCLHIILSKEDFYKQHITESEAISLNELWNKIGIELTRLLQVEESSSCHLLMKSLIINSKLRDPMPVIDLYCRGLLENNVENFLTLVTVCQHCELPESAGHDDGNGEHHGQIRMCLMKWLFRERMKYPTKELSKILITLMVTKMEDENDAPIEKTTETLIMSKNINEFFKLITKSYEAVSLKSLEFESDSNPSERTFLSKVDRKIQAELFHHMEKRFYELKMNLLVEDLPLDESQSVMEETVYCCDLFFSLYSHVLNMNVSIGGWEPKVEIVKNLLFLSTKQCFRLLQNNIFAMGPFVNLYSTKYQMDLNKMIRERDSTYVTFINCLFELFKEGCQLSSGNHRGKKDVPKVENDGSVIFNSAFSNLIRNQRSFLHINSLLQEQRRILEIVEILCQFVITPDCRQPNDFRKMLELKLCRLLVDSDWNLNSSFHIQIVLRVIYNFSKYHGIDKNTLNTNLKFLSSLFEAKKYDSEVIMVILQTMKEYLHLIHVSEHEECVANFLKLLNEFRDLILIKKKCGKNAVIKFIDFLSEMMKMRWEESPANDNAKDDIYKFGAEIIRFLKHNYYEVRLFAAERVGVLFNNFESKSEETFEREKKMMDILKVTLQHCDEENEGNLNHILISSYYKVMGESLALISFSNIICSSSCWRRYALFNLIYLSCLRNFSESKVKRCIALVCDALKVEDTKKFISCHLRYLMKMWAVKGCDPQLFPYYILGCRTLKDFFGAYMNIILPAFAWHDYTSIINSTCSILGKTRKQALQDSFPELMAIILPCLSENVASEMVFKANKLKNVVEKELSSDSTTQLIFKNLDRVVVNMFRNVEDNQYLMEVSHVVRYRVEEFKGENFTVSQVTEALENISHKEGRTLLGEIVLERPYIVQKVLIHLANDVESACLYEDKIIPLYVYVAFVEILSKTTRQIVFSEIVPFIVRDVIYTVIAFIRSYNSNALTDICLKCLKTVIKHYVVEFGDALKDFLPDITILCKPLAIEGNKMALDILQFLICDNFDKLQSAIATLDSFPGSVVFERINSLLENNKRQWNSLEDVVEHFLDASNKRSSTVEGLIYLRNSLTVRKEELKQMYDNLNVLRGFSEDCNRSLLHRLIYVLIELTGDKSSLMRTEAAKCLAELGPSNLTTLVLKPEDYAKEQNYEPPMTMLLKTCIHDLSDLIISENIEMKTVASDLLYVIFSTSDGHEIMKEEDVKRKKYLSPFVMHPAKALIVKNNSSEFKRNVSHSHVWLPRDHKEWIKTLITSLLKSFTDSCGLVDSIIRMVQNNWRFGGRILPIIVDVILSFKDDVQTEVINKNVGAFFEDYFKSRKTCKCGNKDLNVTVLRFMVNLVDYVRIQRNYLGIYDGFDLEVNYLHVAEAARCCSAFFTSMLYVELWFNEKKKTISDLTIEKLCELYPEEGSAIAEILRDCYSKIGVSDGLQGCGYMHLLDADTEIQYYDQMNKRNISMLYHDVRLSQGIAQSEFHLMNSLQQSGMLYSLKNLIQFSENKLDLSNVQYKCASVLSDWSLADVTQLTDKEKLNESFEKYHYFALKAFHNEDHSTFVNEILKARKCTMSKLSSCSLECTQNLYQFLSEFRCLKELEDFETTVKRADVDGLKNLYQKWCQQDCIKFSDFKLVENIFVQRITVMKEELTRVEDSKMKNLLNSMLSEMYCKLIKTARKERQYQTALRNLNYLNRLGSVPDETLGRVKIQKSLLFWEMGEIDVGKCFLFHYMKNGDIKGDLTAKATRIYGDWMASTNSENSKYIIEQYYLKAIEKSTGPKDRVDCYASLAKFADTNYEQIREYLSSPLFEIKKNITNRQQDMALELRQEMGWNLDQEKRIVYRLMERQSAIDVNEIKNSESQKNFFLSIAVKYYLLNLKEGDKYDLLVFRLISLWFSNVDNECVIKLLREHLSDIPTYKFLCLLPQILPRVADVGIINTLVERSIMDHPHHTLPILFALANSYEDSKYSGAKAMPDTPRIVISRTILEKYRKSPALKQLIHQMDRFCDAMIELANTSPGDLKSIKKKMTEIKIPPKLKVSKLRDLDAVPVPVLTMPYRKNCNYRDGVIGIKHFEDRYQLVGGVNVPKKIKCTGSDGISRALLVKGKDDLRQDAVMQQVFTIMNSLLHRNSDTNGRKLVIRTYKVVPLSQRSGIIEWCENTQPLSLYLIGPDAMSGAHKKFNPGDLTASQCRYMLSQVFAVPNVTNDLKLSVFSDICRKFRPAFRHFFFENFPEPGIWFERRLAYTRSVATSSMIGYILGIGDRHVHNILIDNATAEVIHIDLGIAFEQGKTLPTPETVPFRLTRDIVDGMGICGVEGVFRFSCIKTMEVLRENQLTILTLLEVLLYDPLYAWTLTNEKALSVQGRSGSQSSSEKNSSDIEINRMAERALIRLKQKLQGTETGGIATNAEGQVNYLIQQARDPNNLCRLFHGWQAYL